MQSLNCIKILGVIEAKETSGIFITTWIEICAYKHFKCNIGLFISKTPVYNF